MNLDLRFFHEDEFREWKGRMSPRLLIMEDILRYRWGDKITVSPHPRALGRFDGPENKSQHNVDLWGEVRAMDQFLKGMDNRAAAELAIQLMKEIGFTGIGLYPDWDPYPGIHGDVRTTADPGDPAIWGMVATDKGQRQVPINEALRRMG